MSLNPWFGEKSNGWKTNQSSAVACYIQANQLSLLKSGNSFWHQQSQTAKSHCNIQFSQQITQKLKKTTDSWFWESEGKKASEGTRRVNKIKINEKKKKKAFLWYGVFTVFYNPLTNQHFWFGWEKIIHCFLCCCSLNRPGTRPFPAIPVAMVHLPSVPGLWSLKHIQICCRSTPIAITWSRTLSC